MLCCFLKSDLLQNRQNSFLLSASPGLTLSQEPRQDGERFAKELKIIFWTCNTGLTRLYQCMLVGNSDAKKWMEKAELEALKDDVKDIEFHRKSGGFRKTVDIE